MIVFEKSDDELSLGGIFRADSELPLVTGQATSASGLFFCGQIASPTGQLREIGREAQRIAIVPNATGSVSETTSCPSPRSCRDRDEVSPALQQRSKVQRPVGCVLRAGGERRDP